MKKKACNGNQTLYIAVGLLISLFFLAYIEITRPYAFLQNDTLTNFLPGILVGLKQLFSGQLPYLNMHQLAGLPLLEIGTYAFFYPVMLISYIIAHYGIGNDYLLMEIFASIHLLLSFVAMFFLLKRLKMTNLLALVGGVAYAFSGFHMVKSVASYYISTTALFLPLIFLLQLQNLSSPSKKNTILLGLLRGIYFYGAHPQYFIYASLFEFILLLLILVSKVKGHKSREAGKRGNGLPAIHVTGNIRSVFVHYVLSLIITAVVALPLLAPVFVMSKSCLRRGTFALLFYIEAQCRRAVHPLDFIFGNLFPYPLYSAINGSELLRTLPNMNFTGGIFFIFGIIAAITFFRKFRRRIWTACPFLTLGIISAILSFGYLGLVNLAMVIVPLWTLLHRPYRFALFTNFFIVLFGSQALLCFFGPGTSKARRRILSAFIAISLCLMVLQVHYSIRLPFGYHPEAFPLDDTAFEDLTDGRVIGYSTQGPSEAVEPLTSEVWVERTNPATMLTHFASYYGLYSIGGYEDVQPAFQGNAVPIQRWGVSGRAVDIDWLSEWGVRYIFILYESIGYHPELRGMQIVMDLKDDGVLVLENPQAKPIVFCGNAGVEYELLDNGVRFTASAAAATNCTASLVYNKNFVLQIDGEKHQFTDDPLGRMTFNLPPGAHEVVLTYRNPIFIPALLLSIILALAFVVFYGQVKQLVGVMLDLVVSHRKLLLVLLVLCLLLSALNVAHDIHEVIPLEKAVECVIEAGSNFRDFRLCVKEDYITIQRAAMERISTPLEISSKHMQS